MTFDFAHTEKLIRLNFKTGDLFWRLRDTSEFSTAAHGKMWNTRFANTPALASLRADGYLEGFIHGKKVLAHRVVYLLASGYWPSSPIDHLNGIRSDNRPENLRISSVSDNNRNRRIGRNTKTGVMGVCWNSDKGAYDAYITKDGVKHRLGRFADFGTAVQSRRSAELALGFGENHGAN